MLKPLITIARYGNMFEVTRFEKPLVTRPSRPVIIKKRIRSESTFKQLQNVQRAKRRIRHTVQAVMAIRGAPAFATFTYRTKQYDMLAAVEQWRQFTTRMHKELPDVSFIRVPERHEDGGVHFHAIMFGLPNEWPCILQYVKGWDKPVHKCPKERNCERKHRTLAKLWGNGFMDLEVTRDTNAIGPYLAQYLTKGDPDWQLFGLRLASANSRYHQDVAQARKMGVYFKMSSSKNPTGVEMVLEDYALTDDSVLRGGEFETVWLGTARYTAYKLKLDSDTGGETIHTAS